MRKIKFINGEYYHIYNRGVEKREVFLDQQDYWKFLNGLRDFNNNSYYEQRLGALGPELNPLNFKKFGLFLGQQEKVIEVVSYSLNPNHYHLIIRQLKDGGIPNFMHKIGTSFANYFNKKYQRSGALFQGTYKAIHIDNNNYLLWLAGYVNGNIQIHGLGQAETYQWSSYPSILQTKQNPVLNGIEIIAGQLNNVNAFRKFVGEVIIESKTKKEMAKYLLE